MKVCVTIRQSEGFVWNFRYGSETMWRSVWTNVQYWNESVWRSVGTNVQYGKEAIWRPMNHEQAFVCDWYNGPFQSTHPIPWSNLLPITCFRLNSASSKTKMYIPDTLQASFSALPLYLIFMCFFDSWLYVFQLFLGVPSVLWKGHILCIWYHVFRRADTCGWYSSLGCPEKGRFFISGLLFVLNIS